MLKWELSHIGEWNENIDMEALDWRETEVPSSIQTSAFGLTLKELYKKDHVKHVEWMRKAYWLYRTSFEMPEVNEHCEAVLFFKGIDYKFKIYLNGVLMIEREGMFSPAELPLRELKAGSTNDVLVVIEPFEPGLEPFEQLKARYSIGNGWDFAPKLQSAGIWDEAGLEIREKLRVVRAQVKTALANQQRAEVVIDIELSEKIDYGMVTVRLDRVTRSFPVVVTNQLSLPLEISSPTLWWPNGAGEPNLAELVVELRVKGKPSFVFRQKAGLRSVGRVPCKGQAVEDMPLQLTINDLPVFLKGVNWVPLDACPGSITAERYRDYLARFKAAGVNFIRVWGGGLKEKDEFYNIADEFGLLIMQEFPLACQRLARTESFYRLIVQEITSIIHELKHHPSVVIWSGGNEHYHFWDNVDSGTEVMNRTSPIIRNLFGIKEDNVSWHAFADKYDEPSLELMGQLCATLDGTRPFQITSGMEDEGEVHGIWNWNPVIGDHRYRDHASLYDFWLSADQHLYSEASVSSIANIETIRDVLDIKDGDIAVPDKLDPVWQLHHAFKAAWDEHDDLWLDIPSTEKLFGRIENLEDFVFANQWMQGEGGRFLIEETRRNMGVTSGIVWWGVNEPWPGLAGNSLIDYYGRPKLGWSFAANAFRPSILSLRYNHCICRSVKPQLWLSHDAHETFEGEYEVSVTNPGTGESVTEIGRVECAAYSSQYIRTLTRVRLHSGQRLHIKCRLYHASGTLIHENDYAFVSNEDSNPFEGESLQWLKDIFQVNGVVKQTF